MKKVKCVFLFGLILFLNLLSLNHNSSSQSINSLKSASDSVDDPLKVGTTSLGYDLDPAFANDGASHDIIDQVWEGLYAHNLGDQRMRIVPRLASDCGSWNENATVFNVTLRSGITFHNGEPFTAEDVNYTFSRLWELCVFHDSQIRELYFPYGFNTTEMNASIGFGYIINKTVIVDEMHVSFHLNFPYSPFQSLLCFSGSYIVDESTTNTYSYIEFGDINNGTAIGTGPYICTEHASNFTTFEYFVDYYRGTPAIKKIIYQKFGNLDEISQGLLEGGIDLPRRCEWDFRSEFEENPDIFVGPYREGSISHYLVMKNSKIDRTFRHSINYAIDYGKIIKEIYNSEVSRMTSIVPPGITYHKDCEVPIFNITESRQILIDAGKTEETNLNENSSNRDWQKVAQSSKPILEITYTYRGGDSVKEEVGFLIKDNLENIGICVTPVQVGFYYWWLDSGGTDPLYDGDLLYLGWMLDYNDPSQIINFLFSNISSSNLAQVNDPWLQLAMEEALTIANDNDREVLYHDIQEYIATDLMPYAFIVYSSIQNVRANYVSTQPNPMNKLYVFPFSWHGVNTTFNDPCLELWCNSGSPPVLEYWPEPKETISGYSILFVSIFSLGIIHIWIQKNKKKLG